MELESERAKEWLEQFFADVGLRWWPFMASRAGRCPSSFPKTFTAFADGEIKKKSKQTNAADESDEFWAARVRDVRLITRTKTGVPESVKLLPEDELSPVGVASPHLARLGRLVLGPFLLELLSTKRAKLEKLERITDLDDGWLRGLGMLFEFTVMAKYLALDRASASPEKRDELESARQTVLKAIGQLQGEDAARDNAGRSVNDRRRNLIRNSEVLGRLSSMADNRDEVLLKRFLASHGHPDMTFEGHAPARSLTDTVVKGLCEKLKLPEWRSIFAATQSEHGNVLCAAAASAAGFEEAVTKARVTLPQGAREFFAASNRYLSNRNRAIYEYHTIRRKEIGLGGFGSPDDDHERDLLESLDVDHLEVDRAGAEPAEEDVVQVVDEEAGEDFNRSPTFESDHQRQIALALHRLQAPDLQLLWCLMRSRVAVVPNATGNEVTERDTVYAVASNSTRAMLEPASQASSASVRAHLNQVCERLQRTHASFKPGGSKASLFIETVDSALAWFMARGVKPELVRSFTLGENNSGGFVLPAEARRGVAKWKSDLRDRCNKDFVSKTYLLPAISA